MAPTTSVDQANAAAQPTASPPNKRLVIDAPTRMFHWLFALSFSGAYLTADSDHWQLLHVTLGYTMAGLLGLRLLYSVCSPRTSGLGLLWRKLSGGPAWLRTVLAQSLSVQPIRWSQGLHIAMAVTIALLLALVVPLTLSGYATYQDWGRFLGSDWMEEVHGFFGEAMLCAVLAHIALIAALSAVRRKNQALPMLTGRVEGPGPDWVKNNRSWLAALLLLAVLAFGAWQWQSSPNGWTGSDKPNAHEPHRQRDDD